MCPYEPKNAILKDKLEEHLKTCPKKRELDEIASKPWYSKGINFMNPELPSCFDKECREEKLSTLDQETVKVISDKISNLYDMLEAKHKNDEHVRYLFESVQEVHKYYKQSE